MLIDYGDLDRSREKWRNVCEVPTEDDGGLRMEGPPSARSSLRPSVQFPIVNWPDYYYIGVRATLDQAGTDGFVYRFGLAPDRLGRQIVS